MAERALNSIAEGVLIIDASGVIRFANPAAVRLVGAMGLYEVAGLYIFSVLRFEDIHRQCCAWVGVTQCPSH